MVVRIGPSFLSALTATDPPVAVAASPTVSRVLVNSDFTLAVTITGYNVRPTVEWMLNGAPISGGEKYTIVTDVEVLGSGESRLTVQNVEFVNGNESFTVNVSNLHAGGGASLVKFTVHVESKCVGRLST